VALNTDEFVLRYKKKYPIFNLEQRIEILKSCRYVDDVIVNEEGEDSKPSILKVKPDFIIVGSDWAKKDYLSQMRISKEWLATHNITLAYVEYTEGVSSTSVREQIGKSSIPPDVFVAFSPEYGAPMLHVKREDQWFVYSWNYGWIKISEIDRVTAISAYNQSAYVFDGLSGSVINV
jgi:glycerol-3-phosphate cytidylyltransferase-like family protein